MHIIKVKQSHHQIYTFWEPSSKNSRLRLVTISAVAVSSRLYSKSTSSSAILLLLTIIPLQGNGKYWQPRGIKAIDNDPWIWRKNCRDLLMPGQRIAHRLTWVRSETALAYSVDDTQRCYGLELRQWGDVIIINRNSVFRRRDSVLDLFSSWAATTAGITST